MKRSIANVGKSTICNMLKKDAETTKLNESVKAICIDDFALKKRQRYGTIMVDAESGRIIDMIESRETEIVVAKWLSKYPKVEIVSRDGSLSYASAITQGRPNAVQISDRFHLLQNSGVIKSR